MRQNVPCQQVYLTFHGAVSHEQPSYVLLYDRVDLDIEQAYK